jgi:hypothetical protein
LLKGLFLVHVQVVPEVLYGCETWSLTLWDEHRVRVFENWVLRRILGLKKDEVIGGWRKLHNELNNLYCSPSIIKIIKDEMGGACSTNGGEQDCI